MAAPLTAGLDIGATSVRAIEVRRTRTRPTIERYEQVSLPVGAVVGGVVKDDKPVTAALKKLRGMKMLSSRSVALAVTHQQVVVREIEVPNLPPAQLRQALPHLARETMPLAVDEAILDFVPLEEAGKKENVRGLLAAAPREAVAHTVEAVEKAGLHVERVDLACFALLRAIASVADGAEAVLDIGANTTLLVMQANGVPQLVRTIPRGGNDLTALLGRRLDLDLVEAERRKREIGLAACDDLDYRDALSEGLRPLMSEIRSSIGYWLGNRPEPVVRVTLVGGGSRLRGLDSVLRDALDIPTVLGNPLQYLGWSRRGGTADVPAEHRAATAVSVGLTLGGLS